MAKLLSNLMIELHVPDFEIVKKFYKSLGFKVVWERKPNELKGYLVMQKGDSILNFFCGNEKVYEHSFFDKYPKNTTRGYGVEIIIPINGIEEFYKQVLEKHKDLMQTELQTKHSHKDFRIIDPFGFYLRFVEEYDWVHGRDKNGNVIK